MSFVRILTKGSDQYNAVLSQKRAIAAQKWLSEHRCVYALAAGMGKRELMVANENPGGRNNLQNRQPNRRVTVREVIYSDANKLLKKYKL